MSVMISSDKKELMLTCNCNCEYTLHFKINDEDKDYDCYAVQSYLKGDWYTNQDNTIWSVVVKKLKKIIAIIKNKDYYYSEIIMTKEEFQEFKKYINQFD